MLELLLDELLLELLLELLATEELLALDTLDELDDELALDLLELETLDALLEDELILDATLLLADDVPAAVPELALVPPPPQATRKVARTETIIIPQNDL